MERGKVARWAQFRFFLALAWGLVSGHLVPCFVAYVIQSQFNEFRTWCGQELGQGIFVPLQGVSCFGSGSAIAPPPVTQGFGGPK